MFKFLRKKHQRAEPRLTPNITDQGHNNQVKIGDGFDVSKINITIVGDNNTVDIRTTSRRNTGIINLVIHANNSAIFMDSDLYVDAMGLTVELGNMAFEAVTNSTVTIGAHTGIGGCHIVIYNSNANVKIGSDVMMAYAITLYNTDSHPIYSKNDDGEYRLVNHVKDMIIGNHCWLGANSIILKNVSLADGTIVGYGAVVSKSFDEPNIAIAGNPARKVKSGLIWKPYDAEYIKNAHN